MNILEHSFCIAYIERGRDVSWGFVAIRKPSRVCVARSIHRAYISCRIESVETRSEIRLTLRKSIGAHRRRVSDACKACPLQRRGYEKAPLTGSLSYHPLSCSLFSCQRTTLQMSRKLSRSLKRTIGQFAKQCKRTVFA